jgi:5-methylcytosine-specific restriction endonuclease McrA
MARRLFSRREKRALAIYSGFRCAICCRRLDQYEGDHVVPYSKGGATDVRNGQAVCPSCNRKKGDKYEPEKVAENGLE